MQLRTRQNKLGRVEFRIPNAFPQKQQLIREPSPPPGQDSLESHSVFSKTLQAMFSSTDATIQICMHRGNK